jgi:hypothetical protein
MKVVGWNGWVALGVVAMAGCGSASKVTSDGHVPSEGQSDGLASDGGPGDVADVAPGDAPDAAGDGTPDGAKPDGADTDGALDGDGGTPLTYPTLVGGTRLHVNRIVGDDGSSAPIGLYDVEVDAPCSFRLAGDGAMRCLPTGVAGAEVLFTDDKCSKPFAVLPACSPPGDWVYAAVTGSAGVAALKVGPTSRWRARSGASTPTRITPSARPRADRRPMRTCVPSRWCSPNGS